MRRSPAAVAVAPSEEEAPASSEALRTEFAFTLPRGYVDAAGMVHRDGIMRLATARDELVPLRDDRVRENPAYLTVVLLARVVTRLGKIDDVHAGVIENLFASVFFFNDTATTEIYPLSLHDALPILPVAGTAPAFCDSPRRPKDQAPVAG